MHDQEMLREIKRVLELTSRIDERVSCIADSNIKISERFDKFLEQHSHLADRVTRLESNTWSGNKIEDHLDVIQTEQTKITGRLSAVEVSVPFALKIVDQSLEALNKLSDRVSKMETEQQQQGTTVKTWQKWVNWVGDWCLKLAWIVIASYILAKVGINGMHLPEPF